MRMCAKRVTVILGVKEYDQFKEAAGLIPLSRWMKEQCISMLALRLEKKLVSDLEKYGDKIRDLPPVRQGKSGRPTLTLDMSICPHNMTKAACPRCK
jgi:hypothetical protein